jgi:alkylation response protein AidB-like acyl-CoA dehydrogenase
VSGGKLSGTKLPVTDGDIATHALVLAKENGQAGLFLVDLSAGVKREPLQTLDPTRDAARLTFSGAAAERLGGAGEGFALLEQINDRAAVLLAFEQTGGADRCLEMAKAYALERYAFGRVIASYQAIKHKLADIYVKNELARSNAYYGAWALNTNAPELPVAASAARIAAVGRPTGSPPRRTSRRHGGIGFTWEVDAHLFYRRSRQLALVAGAPRVWKERLVSHLERRNAARSAHHGLQRLPEEAAYRAEARDGWRKTRPRKQSADEMEGGTRTPWPPPRPGRPRRPPPATPRSPGPRNGAGRAARRSSR